MKSAPVITINPTDIIINHAKFMAWFWVQVPMRERHWANYVASLTEAGLQWRGRIIFGTHG